MSSYRSLRLLAVLALFPIISVSAESTLMVRYQIVRSRRRAGRSSTHEMISNVPQNVYVWRDDEEGFVSVSDLQSRNNMNADEGFVSVSDLQSRKMNANGCTEDDDQTGDVQSNKDTAKHNFFQWLTRRVAGAAGF